MMFKELKKQLWQVIDAYMQEYGYTPDEIKQYCFVEYKPWDESSWEVEVRAELDYEPMIELSERLDPIVQKYDKNAYFDMEEPGIMSAIIEVGDVEASTKITAGIYRSAFDSDREYFYYLLGVVGRKAGNLRREFDNLSDAEVEEGIKLFDRISKSLKNYVPDIV